MELSARELVDQYVAMTTEERTVFYNSLEAEDRQYLRFMLILHQDKFKK